MPHEEQVRKWEISRGSNTLVERKYLLHDKKVSNNNVNIIQLLSTDVSTERGSNNKDLTTIGLRGGDEKKRKSFGMKGTWSLTKLEKKLKFGYLATQQFGGDDNLGTWMQK